MPFLPSAQPLVGQPRCMRNEGQERDSELSTPGRPFPRGPEHSTLGAEVLHEVRQVGAQISLLFAGQKELLRLMHCATQRDLDPQTLEQQQQQQHQQQRQRQRQRQLQVQRQREAPRQVSFPSLVNIVKDGATDIANDEWDEHAKDDAKVNPMGDARDDAKNDSSDNYEFEDSVCRKAEEDSAPPVQNGEKATCLDECSARSRLPSCQLDQMYGIVNSSPHVTHKRTSRYVEMVQSLEASIEKARSARKNVEGNRSFLARLASHYYFDAAVVVVCIANVVAVGLQIDAEARGGRMPRFLLVGEHFCTLIFLTELMIRIGGFKWRLISSGNLPWTIFDASLVTLSLVDLYFFYGAALNDNNSGLVYQASSMGTFVKVLRVVRILRIFRMLRFLANLRVMVSMIMNSMMALFWLFVLLSFMMFGFGNILTHGATVWKHTLGSSHHVNSGDDSHYKRMQHYFGSVPNTMYTLFLSISSGVSWGEPAALALSCGGFYFTVFVIYIFIAFFSVLNIVTGVFVENAIDQAKGDRILRQMQADESRKAYAKDLHELLLHLDQDGDQTISWEEWEKSAKDRSIRDLLSSLDINGGDAVELFRCLDVDGDGRISIGELVSGIQKMKGNARSIEMHQALRLLNTIHQQNLMVKQWLMPSLESSNSESHEAHI